MTSLHSLVLAVLCLCLISTITVADASTHSNHNHLQHKQQHHKHASITSQPSSLSNEHIQLTFGANTQLTEFVELATQTNFLGTPNATDSWWSLTVVTPGSDAIFVDLFTPAQSIVVHQSNINDVNQNATFVYDNLLVDASSNSRLTVTWVLSLPANASEISFQLYVSIGSSSSSNEIGIENVNVMLKNVNHAARSSNDFLVWPTGFGMGATNPATAFPHGLNSAYPNSEAAYQLLMYYFEELNADNGLANGPGLKMAVYDAEASSKYFLMSPREDGINFDLAVQLIPENAGLPIQTGGKALFSYNVVVGVFRGDWYDGSRLYKNWALRSAQWATGGVLRDRDDFPSWLLNTNLWINSGWQPYDVFNKSQGNPDVVLQRVSDIVNLFNITASSATPLGLHWYEWNTKLFDTGYPDYFPEKAGFNATLPKLQAMNVRVHPYINGRIFDHAAASWLQDDAVQYACKYTSNTFNASDLTLFTESYGSGATFSPICPSQQYWTDKIASVTSALINEYGVDGVYIDQIGAATPKICADPSHDHSIKGGNYWSNGYWDLLTAVRKSFQAGPAFNAILTESNAEPYMHKLNVYLTLVAFSLNMGGDDSAIVPVFPSIYSGFYLGMGAEFSAQDLTIGNGDVFVSKVAKQLLEGAQIGWFSLGGDIGLYDSFMSGEYGAEISLLQQTNLYRSLAKDHVTFGRRVRDLAFQYQAVTNDTSSIAGKVYQMPRQGLIRKAEYERNFAAFDKSREKKQAHHHNHHDHHHHHHHHHADSESNEHVELSRRMHARAPNTITYDALSSAIWLSEIGCTIDRITMGMFFVSVEEAAPEYSISFSIDLRDYELTDAAGENFTVNQVHADGSKTNFGTFPGTNVTISNLVIQPREIMYLVLAQV